MKGVDSFGRVCSIAVLLEEIERSILDHYIVGVSMQYLVVARHVYLRRVSADDVSSPALTFFVRNMHLFHII